MASNSQIQLTNFHYMQVLFTNTAIWS